MKKLKIAFVIGKFDNAGTRTYVMNYFNNFDHSRITVDFLVYKGDGNTDYSPVTDFGGKVFELNKPSPLNPKKYIGECKSIFSEEKYDIVHSFINTMNVFPMLAAKKAGIPVRISHNLSTGKLSEKKTIIKLALRPFNRFFYTHAAANSIYCGKWMFGKKPFEVFRNGINPNKYYYNQELRNETRAEYGLENKFVIGHIGRYEQQKNHNFLIDILAQIKKIEPDAVLMLIGFGSLKEQVFERIDKLGLRDSVIDLGGRSDIDKFYNAMDCFVLPSLYEGLPIVAIESQATGLPVIMSSEITSEASVCDKAEFLSLDQSASEWANAVLKYKDLSRENGTDAIVIGGYDSKDEAARMQQFYMKACGLEQEEILV